MTDNEKAKAYDEALERAKDGLTDKRFCETEDTIRSVVEYIFPQLCESEDERIIRIIKKVVSSANRGDQMMLGNKETSDVLSWLEKQKDLDKMIAVSPEVWDKAIADAYENGKKDGEKQKEQKHEEWSEEDKAIIGCIVCCLDGQFVTEAARKQCLEWFNKHRRDFLNQPKQEWSEEDEEMLNSCISSIEESKENRYAYKETDGDTSYDHEIAWLKSLRPSWKPSEEQMLALKYAIDKWENGQGVACPSSFEYYVIKEMYEQLKKLM